MELLECKNLTKCFDNKKILDNINLIIPRGKIIGFLGKNGTGKTTLIKIINDLLTIDEGKILINCKEIGPESKKMNLVPGFIVREQMGFLKFLGERKKTNYYGMSLLQWWNGTY